MNQEKEIPARNLINIFRNYYKLSIHNFIGISGNSIMMGLLYKFNEMGFPDKLKISANEMFGLSGLSDIRTLRNARNKLTAYLHTENDPDSWILKYTENSTKEYGTYELNYTILIQLCSNIDVKLQESSSNIPVDLQESSSKKSRLSTKIEAHLDPKSAKNALLSNTILDDNIKENISSSVPQDLIVPGNEIENEKNDNDIVAVAEEIADRKIELTEQIVAIQKKLIARYSLQEWDKKPSYQFLKDLIKINESYGGFEYVVAKIDQMPIPLEVAEIGKVLRAWCQRPEKGNNVNIQKPQVSELQIEMENKIAVCRNKIQSCRSVEDGFWELLSERMKLEKESDFKSVRGTARDLWHGYERERLRFDPEKTLEWFMETFMNGEDIDSWD